MIDTHLHLFDPVSHAFAEDAPYHPRPDEWADWPALEALMNEHDISQGVLVSPTAGYNHDVAALQTLLAPARPRLVGVTRLAGTEPWSLFDTLSTQGVVGIRLDVQNDGHAAVLGPHARGMARQWALRGWFVQVQASAADWVAIAPVLSSWSIPIVIDHCGQPDTRAGLNQPGFQAILELAKSGRTWIKLSGAFRFSRQSWPHADTDPYAAALFYAYGAQRCVWGSDWPFVRLPQRPAYADVFQHLSRWVPDAAQRNTVLNDSPLELMDMGRKG
ncbi:MAG: amidohydrolase family protein [Ramlibacter sp.]